MKDIKGIMGVLSFSKQRSTRPVQNAGNSVSNSFQKIHTVSDVLSRRNTYVKHHKAGFDRLEPVCNPFPGLEQRLDITRVVANIVRRIAIPDRLGSNLDDLQPIEKGCFWLSWVLGRCRVRLDWRK